MSVYEAERPRVFTPVMSHPARCCDITTLAEGEVILQRPVTLSAQSMDELEHWLMLVLKQLRRRRARLERANVTPVEPPA